MLVFEWDAAKAAGNKRKHGISFEEAMLVFEDPYAIFDEDCFVEGERRWRVLGAADDLIVIFVVHVMREQGENDIVRIISARRATRTERMLYEQNRHQNTL